MMILLIYFIVLFTYTSVNSSIMPCNLLPIAGTFSTAGVLVLFFLGYLAWILANKQASNVFSIHSLYIAIPSSVHGNFEYPKDNNKWYVRTSEWLPNSVESNDFYLHLKLAQCRRLEKLLELVERSETCGRERRNLSALQLLNIEIGQSRWFTYNFTSTSSHHYLVFRIICQEEFHSYMSCYD